MTLSHRYIASLSTTASAGAGGAILGAFTHQDVLTWAGVVVAIASAAVSGAVAGYHKIREAARQEDLADKEAAELATRRQIQAQITFESKIQSNAKKVAILEQTMAELVERVRRERCPFAQDGHAHCEGKDCPEPPEPKKNCPSVSA
jgi:hypothetical protein